VSALPLGQWICVQLGAREHYAVPRALHSLGRLERLVTDAWVRPGHPFSFLDRYLKGRYHDALDKAAVDAGGMHWLLGEMMMRARRGRAAPGDWSLLMSRNAAFDDFAAARTLDILGRRPRQAAGLFAYSYASSRTLRVAAESGCRAVMGQIDGGPAEEEIVLREKERFPGLREQGAPAPSAYWSQWREQCDTADRIVVNSEWSRACMKDSGVDERKLVVLPLYFVAAGDVEVRPPPPRRFSADRPLRVLFLGQVNLRKGAARLFEAMRLLKGEPVEFSVVGPASVEVPDEVRKLPGARFVGPVSRDAVAEHYRHADVFLLPTLSDGFALTQLEARSFGLPVIASQRCGAVVQDGVDGIVLRETSAEEIAQVLRALGAAPERLLELRPKPSASPLSLEGYGRALLEAFAA
jgi:hypothetical protein